MKLKYDFKLSYRFGVVEKLIFRMVINGMCSIESITALLPIFSEDVIALSIRKLVNAQLLKADIVTHTLSPSDVLLSVIDSCVKKEYDIEIPKEFESELIAGNKITIDNPKVNAVILRNLLPDVKTAFLSGWINFVAYGGEENGQSRVG